MFYSYHINMFTGFVIIELIKHWPAKLYHDTRANNRLSISLQTEHCPLAADLTKVRPAQQLHCSSISSVGRKLGGRKVVSEGIGELVFSAS